MKLINRKDFDRRITSGSLNVIQAIGVKGGFCLVAGNSSSEEAFMLQRTDKKPYLWINELGPSTYAKTRGCTNLQFFYRESLTVNDILAGGLINV